MTLIEILVHLELDESELPAAYRLLRVTAPDKLRISRLRLPSGDAWKSNLALTIAEARSATIDPRLLR